MADGADEAFDAGSVRFSASGGSLSSGSSEKISQVDESDWCDVRGVGGTLELSGLVMSDFKAGFLKLGEAALTDICLESLVRGLGVLGRLLCGRYES